EFVGRVDDQVKIRGFRVEPGEVEAVLASHPAVTQAAVIPGQTPGGARTLVAYVVSAPGQERPTPQDLRGHVSQTLPDYLVPSAVLVLDAFPLTANGKLDRAALPAPDFTAMVSGRAPRSAREAALCALFADALNLPEVGVDDGFFDLGGDSILSIQLVSRARKAGLVITPRQVFQYKTPAALAVVAKEITANPVPPDVGTGAVPPLPIMRWWREHGGGLAGFHQSVVLEVPPELDEDWLLGAVRAVLDRHDALRLRLVDEDWNLEITPPGSVAERDCVRRVAVSENEEFRSVIDREGARAQAELDPASGRVLRVVWFDAGPDRTGRLLLAVHHFAVDGVSWRILVPDLRAAWQALAEGRRPELDPVPTSLRRWARELSDRALDAEREAELPWWTRTLDGPEPPLGRRPLDPSRDTVASVRSLSTSLSPEHAEPLLTRIPAAFHCGANEVLLTALALALGRWRHADSAVRVDLEGHGREPTGDGLDLSRTVGWFTSLYPVRLDPGTVDLADVGQALKRVKEQLRAVPGNGVGYGMLRHLNPRTRARLAELAEPQIGFNYLGRFATGGGARAWAPAEEAPALDGGQSPDTPAPHCLEIAVICLDSPDGSELSITWSWPGDLFTEDEVRELAEAWGTAARALADCADGGHSPSDLPLVSLTQSDVELLEAEHSGLVDVLPLTALQEGLLYHLVVHNTQRSSQPDVYTVQLGIDVTGALNKARLRDAASDLLARHPNLRAAFVRRGPSGPVQVIRDGVRPPWRELDLTGFPDSERDSALLRLLDEDAGQPFDPVTPPLLRFTVIRLDAHRHRLVLTAHHILVDGWSLPLLVRDLFALYAGDTSLPGPAPYRDYLRWLVTRDRAAAAAAWRAALTGLAAPTLVAPPGRSRAPLVPRRILFDLPADLVARMTAQARQHSLTLNTLVQGAWGLLLAELTGRTDVVFGATVAGRPADLPGVEEMVGLFINTVPVRVRVDPGESVLTLLTRTQDQQTALIPHQHLGLTEIARLAGFGELFDTMMAFENYPVAPDSLAAPGTGLRLAYADSRDGTHYPLVLLAGPSPDGLSLRLEYRPDVFDDRVADGIANRLRDLLETIVDGEWDER
ncbi:condensation domain-containing protein, partial [Goodfellowiella coeruleoviolacea]